MCNFKRGQLHETGIKQLRGSEEDLKGHEKSLKRVKIQVSEKTEKGS